MTTYCAKRDHKWGYLPNEEHKVYCTTCFAVGHLRAKYMSVKQYKCRECKKLAQEKPGLPKQWQGALSTKREYKCFACLPPELREKRKVA